MAKMKIKKGDLVQVTSGRSQKNGGDRGKQGKVIAVYPDTQRVLVEGINRSRSTPRPAPPVAVAAPGGIVSQEAPVHVSNVAVGGPGDQAADPHQDPRRRRRA
jgi:large subunit ribosomal protein L24